VPRIALEAECARRFRHGQRIALSDLNEHAWLEEQARHAAGAPTRLRVDDAQGQLLGLACVEDGCLAPMRLIGQSCGQASAQATNSQIEEVL